MSRVNGFTQHDPLYKRVKLLVSDYPINIRAVLGFGSIDR